MNSLTFCDRLVCRLSICIYVFLSPTAFGNDAERTEILKIAREQIAAATFPALITTDSNGQPRARTVDAFPPDENFVVWIATRPVTRKVEQIRVNPRVTLYYWNESTKSYVTLMGEARLVDDLETKQKLRRPQDNEKFYPAFPKDYLLIKVVPMSLEAIVPGYRGDPETWKPATVKWN